MALLLLGALLIAIGAKISIPLQPVPITLQSLAVLLIGMMYGLRLGVITVLAYLAAGLAGMPVFAIASGSMTSGYLVGFVLAVALTGFLADRGWMYHVFSSITAALLGMLIILLCGWIVLSKFVGPAMAFDEGIKPFLLIGALKVICLAVMAPTFWRLVKMKD